MCKQKLFGGTILRGGTIMDSRFFIKLYRADEEWFRACSRGVEVPYFSLFSSQYVFYPNQNLLMMRKFCFPYDSKMILSG